MICPRCGTANREGASYCDSCGDMLKPGADPLFAHDGPESDEDEPVLLQRGGLGSLMALDWLLRFGAVAVVGFLVGLWTLSMGEYGYALFFFLLCVVGVLGTRWVARAK